VANSLRAGQGKPMMRRLEVQIGPSGLFAFPGGERSNAGTVQGDGAKDCCLAVARRVGGVVGTTGSIDEEARVRRGVE
jgi:hypothetical protein